MSFKPGDVVTIVSACCAKQRAGIGLEGTVGAVYRAAVRCQHCRRVYRGPVAELAIAQTHVRGPAPFPWIIRREPPGPCYAVEVEAPNNRQEGR